MTVATSAAAAGRRVCSTPVNSASLRRRRSGSSKFSSSTTSSVQHALADLALHRGELLKDAIGHRAECTLYVRQRIDLRFGDQIQRFALGVPRTRVPQSAQRELQQWQAIGEAGRLAGELVDERGRAEAKAHPFGRFRNGALDLQEADRGEVALVALTQQPHVQRLQDIAAFEARQMVGAQGEQDAASKAPRDRIRFRERNETVAKGPLFIGVAAQREQFLELVDEQQERLAFALRCQLGHRSRRASRRFCVRFPVPVAAAPMACATAAASAATGMVARRKAWREQPRAPVMLLQLREERPQAPARTCRSPMRR